MYKMYILPTKTRKKVWLKTTTSSHSQAGLPALAYTFTVVTQRGHGDPFISALVLCEPCLDYREDQIFMRQVCDSSGLWEGNSERCTS
jgi:hypothetical protein